MHNGYRRISPLTWFWHSSLWTHLDPHSPVTMFMLAGFMPDVQACWVVSMEARPIGKVTSSKYELALLIYYNLQLTQHHLINIAQWITSSKTAGEWPDLLMNFFCTYFCWMNSFLTSLLVATTFTTKLEILLWKYLSWQDLK